LVPEEGQASLDHRPGPCLQLAADVIA